MKKWLYSLGAIVLGCMIYFFAGAANHGKVMCGEREMQPGDHCEHTRNGIVTSTKTYDEQKSENEQSRVIALYAGPVIAVGGVIGLGVAAFGKKKPRPGPPVSLGQQFAAGPAVVTPPPPPQQPPFAGQQPAGGMMAQPYQGQPPHPGQPRYPQGPYQG